MRRWRHRPFQAAAVVALAALLTACAALAPLYYRAMQQSLTPSVLTHAPIHTSSLYLLADVPSEFDPSRPVVPPETVADQLDPRYRDDFLPPMLGYTGSGRVPRDYLPILGPLEWHSGQCEHIEIDEGTCPRKPGQIAVSTDDAENFGFAPGTEVGVAGISDGEAPSDLATLTVVGTYRQRPDAYWLGKILTGGSGIQDDWGLAITHDHWLTARSTFEDRTVGVSTQQSSAWFGVDVDAVGIDDMLQFPAMVDDLDAVDLGRRADFSADTGLGALAGGVQRQIDQARVTVPLVLAQLFLLGVVVLWLVLAAITEQRRPEVALARLRGHSRRAAQRLVLAELLPMALLALVPGALLAYAATWVVGDLFLPDPVVVELRWPFAAALVLAGLTLTVLVLLAARRVTAEPVEGLLRRVPPRRAGAGLALGEVVVVAGAGALVVALAAGGLTGPVALATPGLIGIAVGVVLARVVIPSAASAGRWLLGRGRVPTGASLLEAARSPATRRVVAIVTIASAVAVFSADALVVGQRNRTYAAQQLTGAPMVAEIWGTDIASVRAVLDELDPSGMRATPVVKVLGPPEDDDDAVTVGVLPDAFTKIAFFPTGAPDPAQWSEIAPPDAEPLTLTGSTMSIDVTDSSLRATRDDGSTMPVTVGVDLIHASGQNMHTTLGEMAAGDTRRTFARTVSCRDGCILTGIWVKASPLATMSGAATFAHLLAGPSGTALSLGPAGQWWPYSPRETGGLVPSSAAPGEVTVEVHHGTKYELRLPHVWDPAVMPTLVAGRPPSGEGDIFPMPSLDGGLQDATAIGALRAVAGSPPRTIVADLDALLRGHGMETNDQVSVWFAEEDRAFLDEVTATLAERGVTVSRTATLTDVRASYDESAAAWSLQLAALVGALAVLCALLALVISTTSGWRGRAHDLAALRMSGIGRRSIRSMAVAAQLPAVLVGVLAGATSGMVGARLAMPIVPLFANAPDVSTLDLGTAPVAVLVAAGSSLIVLCAASVVLGRTLARHADLHRLRDTT